MNRRSPLRILLLSSVLLSSGCRSGDAQRGAEAKEDCESGDCGVSKDARRRLEYARTRVAAGDLQSAGKIAEELSGSEEDDLAKAGSALLRASILAARGEARAVAAYQQAVDAAMDAEIPDLLVDARLGLALELARFDPHGDRAARLLAQVESATDPARPIERALVRAEILRRLGRFSDARAALADLGEPTPRQEVERTLEAVAVDLADGQWASASERLDHPSNQPIRDPALYERLRLARAQLALASGEGMSEAATELDTVFAGLDAFADAQAIPRALAGDAQARLSLALGDGQAALTQAKAARDACEAAPEQAALECLRVHETLGQVAMAQADFELALASFELALARAEALLGPEATQVGVLRGERATALAQQGKSEDAALEFAAAVRTLDARQDKGALLAPVLAEQGELMLTLNKQDAAILALERARVIAPDQPALRAKIEWALARAGADGKKGEERERAEGYAKAALERYRGLGPEWAARVGEIEAWLAAR
ncbi:MAG: hypothetical protein KC457_18730 [Myxococcales bacterium]|nr:hypothetical protein [Myxococcales bacterium]